MFLLGHSCWSYIFSKLTGRPLKVNLPAYLALLAGTLPDFDIYFRPWVQHHTYTHSLIILLPISAAIVIMFRGAGFAFSAGILSHLVADYLVGTIPPLYPLSNFQLGMSLGLPSLADTGLEIGGLGVVVILGYLNGDYKLVTKPQKASLFLSLPLVAIVTLSFLFLGDNSISLSSFAFSRKALTLITVGHAILIGVLTIGVSQGVSYVLVTTKANPQVGRSGSSTVNSLLPKPQVTFRLNPSSKGNPS